MTSRFDVERAVLASDLPTSATLIMFVLLAHSDNEIARVLAKFTPSLTVLARESRLHRSTVQRMLRRLESDGWVIREPVVEGDSSRPPPEVYDPGAKVGRAWPTSGTCMVRPQSPS